MADSLDRRYTALEELGSGGFSTVFRGRDEKLGRDVALKVMHPALLSDATFVERFHREAQVAANLRHPHIVTVYDYGEYEDRLCLVMDLMAGGSLADLLAAGRLPWQRVLEITVPVADALDYAHGQDLIHRDVKPHNILLDEAGRAALADFGVVRALQSGTVARTMSGGVVGTAAYIPVEIWDGEPPSPRTDVYALACVVYEMVTGERLFQGSSISNTIRLHLRPPEFPEAWPEGAPAGLEQVLSRALAQYPSDRYQSAGALAQALSALEAHPGTAQRPGQVKAARSATGGEGRNEGDAKQAGAIQRAEVSGDRGRRLDPHFRKRHPQADESRDANGKSGVARLAWAIGRVLLVVAISLFVLDTQFWPWIGQWGAIPVLASALVVAIITIWAWVGDGASWGLRLVRLLGLAFLIDQLAPPALWQLVSQMSILVWMLLVGAGAVLVEEFLSWVTG